MKKEKIILAIVIAAFSICLSIMEKGKSNDTLPQLDEIKRVKSSENLMLVRRQRLTAIPLSG